MAVMNIILASVSAFVLSFLLSLAVLKLFPRWGLMDNPKKYGYTRAPIPLSGGVVIPLVFALITLLFLPFEKHLFALTFGAVALAGVSFWDDRGGLSPVFRLGFQLFLALFVVVFGVGIEVISNPLGGHFDLTAYEINIPWRGIFYQITVWADLFTIIWLIAMINTLNWLDGVVGLSAGTALAGGITLGVLSLTSLVNQPEIALLSFVFSAAILGFLFFNFPPPKMLLGDAGAMPLGFILAVLAIFSGGKVATAFLVLALPLLDAFWVAFSRLVRGKKPWEGRDKAHLHDRLLLLGWSERQIFFLFFAVAVSLGVSSLLIATFGKGVMILAVLLGFLAFRFWVERTLNLVKK